MSLWPTFNIATIMTAVIVPASGYHNTTVWYGQNPDPRPEETEWFIDSYWWFKIFIQMLLR